MKKYSGFCVCCVLMCLLAAYIVSLCIPCLEYKAVGVFLEAKDGGAYMALGDGRGYPLGHAWDNDYLVNDDVCRAYNVIDLGRYDTSAFRTGDVVSLTRNTSWLRRCCQQLWVHAHATGEYKKIAADFVNSQPRSGNSLDFVSYEDPQYWFMHWNNGGAVSFGDVVLQKVGDVSHANVRVGLGLDLESSCRDGYYRFYDDSDDVPDFVWYYD